MDHSSRPTLPPLHSLNLPRGNIHVHDDHRVQPNPQLATPSDSGPCLRPCTNTPALPLVAVPLTPTSWVPHHPPHKVRLLPTTFENANAIVVVPPRQAPNVPSQPLLFVGSAVERLRQFPDGARVHPYRIARRPDGRPPTGPSQSKAA